MSNFVPEIVYASRVFRAPYAYLTNRASSDELQSLRRSIRQVGVKTPILVDASDNIIDGYRRLVTCLDLGMRLDEVPIEVRDVPSWEAESLVLRLNEHRLRRKAPTAKPKARRTGQEYGPLLPGFLEKVQECRNLQLNSSAIALLLGVSKQRVYYAFRQLPPPKGRDCAKTSSFKAQAEILRSIGRHDVAELMASAYVGTTERPRFGRARITFDANNPESIQDSVRRCMRSETYGWKFAPATLRIIAKCLNELADEAEAGGDKK